MKEREFATGFSNNFILIDMKNAVLRVFPV